MSENSDIWNYKYYDTPDGEDCLKKLIAATKFTGILGMFASSLDILFYSHPKGYGAMLGRFAYTTFPSMGMGAAYAAVTCAATNFRKKDDVVNSAFGGLAAGAVWGAWKKSFRFGCYGGLALALCGALVKDSYINNWNITFPKDAPKMHSDLFWIHKDYSITQDPGRTWKRSTNE